MKMRKHLVLGAAGNHLSTVRKASLTKKPVQEGGHSQGNCRKWEALALIILQTLKFVL